MNDALLRILSKGNSKSFPDSTKSTIVKNLGLSEMISLRRQIPNPILSMLLSSHTYSVRLLTVATAKDASKHGWPKT